MFCSVMDLVFYFFLLHFRTTGRERARDHDQDRDGGRDRNRERQRQEYSDRHEYRRSDDYYHRGYDDDPYYRGGQRWVYIVVRWC